MLSTNTGSLLVSKFIARHRLCNGVSIRMRLLPVMYAIESAALCSAPALATPLAIYNIYSVRVMPQFNCSMRDAW